MGHTEPGLVVVMTAG